MNRQTLGIMCAVTLVAVTIAGPATALARPVRTAPTLGPGAGSSVVGLAGSVPPSGPAAPSDKSLPSLPSGVSASATDPLPVADVQWMNAWVTPITGFVDRAASRYDSHTIYLEQGEEIWLDLYGPEIGEDFDLYLYNPSNTLAYASNVFDTSEESITGTADVQGTWTVVVDAFTGSGDYELYANFGSADDNVPAVPIPPSRVETWLDAYSDWDDVYRIWLNAGDVLTLTLRRGSMYTAGFYPNLYLYAPGTTDVWSDAPIEGREGMSFPKTIAYAATTSGYYYADIYEYAATREQGEAYLNWKVSSPVYRFYNFTNNTHFFTPSLDEANTVIATWSNVFRYEGVGYYINPANNTQPLYRFYNRNSRSHFYTASAEEANTIVAKYSNVFTYDGQTYAVNPAPVANSAPVYRFYNLRNGSHFYTASAEEADMVIATWPTIYRYEGPAFWIGQ